jgi:hypothetical protein
VISGRPSPRSHFDTAWVEMPRKLAGSSWVLPFFFRNSFRFYAILISIREVLLFCFWELMESS